MSSPTASPAPQSSSPSRSTAPITVQLVGGPTALIDIGGVRLLTDPTFDEPGDHPVGQRVLVKTTGPAVTAQTLGRVDAVLLSHDQHPDNLDNDGRTYLSTVPLVLTTAAAQQRLGGSAQELPSWRSITLPRPDGGEVRVTGVPAQHGPMGSEHLTGEVRGFVVSGEGLPTVYIGGDNASFAVVADVAQHAGPIDIAFLFGGHGRSPVMDAYLTFNNDQLAPAAEIIGAPTIIPIHVEGWGHLREDPDAIPAAFAARGLSDRLLILRPGEVTTVSAR